MEKVLKEVVLIAGGGLVPVIVLEKLLQKNSLHFVIKMPDVWDDYGDLDRIIKDNNVPYFNIPVLRLDTIINLVIKDKIKNIVLVGKINKLKLSFFTKCKIFGFIPFFKLSIIPGLHSIRLFVSILKLKNKGDNYLTEVLISYLNTLGIEVVNISEIAPEIIAGSNTSFSYVAIPQDYESDVTLGEKVIENLSSCDVGQSVIVQNGRVIGIEAAEGTDALIDRCSEFFHSYGRRPVLIKMSKVSQNLKIDMPCVGKDTIEKLVKYNFGGLAVQAKKVMILNQEEVLRIGKSSNLFITFID